MVNYCTLMSESPCDERHIFTKQGQSGLNPGLGTELDGQNKILYRWWVGGVSDFRSNGREFDSRSGHYQVVTIWRGDCLHLGI